MTCLLTVSWAPSGWNSSAALRLRAPSQPSSEQTSMTFAGTRNFFDSLRIFLASQAKLENAHALLFSLGLFAAVTSIRHLEPQRRKEPEGK